MEHEINLSVSFGVITNYVIPIGCSLTYKIGEIVLRKCVYRNNELFVLK